MMDDKEMKQFSRTAMLLVTGLSFVGFSKLLQVLDGGYSYPVFTRFGVIALLAGLVSGISTSLKRSQEK